MSGYYKTITYNSGTSEKVWIDDTPVVAPPIRYITVRAFMQRFTQAERIALRASSNTAVIDAMEDLKIASYVNLDDAGIAPGLTYLAAQNLIASNQITAMVANGTEAEAYRGVL